MTRGDDRGGELDAQAIAELRGRLRGPMLVGGDAGYDEARSLWNAMIDRRPTAIARCLGAADVAAGVGFARDRGLALTIRGGGHNIAGMAAADGGLMLDLSLMRGVWVDPAARLARVQPGCLLGDVDRETQAHGLAAVLGFVSATGVAGLTLGGGFGYLTRRYGWTSDTVRAIDVVTAEGRFVRASDRENEDLFWGLRGGGGNFGVATGFEYELFPVGPQIMAGAIAWRAEQAPEVLELYRELVLSSPPELALVAGLRLAPAAPWIRKDMHGRPIVALFACHTGSIAEGERLVAPIKAFGDPVGDIVQRRPYTAQQSLLDAANPKGRRYYWKSEYLPGVTPELLARVADHAARVTSPHSAILIFPLEGALNRLPEHHSPVGNRDAAAVLNIAASWESPADDAANLEWAREAWRDLRRDSTGGTYVNFLNADDGAERIRAAYGANYGRLVEIKSKWDPQNLFRANKNIAPGGR